MPLANWRSAPHPLWQLLTSAAGGMIACNQTLTILLTDQLSSAVQPDHARFAPGAGGFRRGGRGAGSLVHRLRRTPYLRRRTDTFHRLRLFLYLLPPLASVWAPSTGGSPYPALSPVPIKRFVSLYISPHASGRSALPEHFCPRESLPRHSPVPDSPSFLILKNGNTEDQSKILSLLLALSIVVSLSPPSPMWPGQRTGGQYRAQGRRHRHRRRQLHPVQGSSPPAPCLYSPLFIVQRIDIAHPDCFPAGGGPCPGRCPS